MHRGCLNATSGLCGILAALDGPMPYGVLAASGSRLVLEAADGARFEAIDAMSSWWCAIHGYRSPALDAALHDQAARFSQVPPVSGL